MENIINYRNLLQDIWKIWKVRKVKKCNSLQYSSVFLRIWISSPLEWFTMYPTCLVMSTFLRGITYHFSILNFFASLVFRNIIDIHIFIIFFLFYNIIQTIKYIIYMPCFSLFGSKINHLLIVQIWQQRKVRILYQLLNNYIYCEIYL